MEPKAKLYMGLSGAGVGRNPRVGLIRVSQNAQRGTSHISPIVSSSLHLDVLVRPFAVGPKQQADFGVFKGGESCIATESRTIGDSTWPCSLPVLIPLLSIIIPSRAR